MQSIQHEGGGPSDHQQCQLTHPGEAKVEVKGKPGRALGDEIPFINKSRLKARASRLMVEEMSRVDEALAITLELLVPPR